MLLRSFLFAGLLLLSGCAYDDGYYGGNSAGYGETAGYYGGGGYYGAPYQPGPPVYGSPYVSGPLVYYYGDDDSGHRRHHRHDDGDNGGWHHGNGNHGGWQNNGGNGHWQNNPDRPWQSQGQNQGRYNDQNWQIPTDRNPDNHNQKNEAPRVYQVPRNPDGSGAPTFLPNGCGGNGQPRCH